MQAVLSHRHRTAFARFLFARFALFFSFMAGAVASNPPPTQLFYIPFPEDQQLAAFKSINGTAGDPLAVFITFSAATDGTVIYYDHWEDGYEEDITNPVQPTTLVFGDGNPANGYPPGNAGDLIPAGTVFHLRNFVATGTLQSVLDFDARDKIASFKPISVTKTSFPAGTNTLLAGCVEVFEHGLWGTEYRSPVGVDMPTSTATSTLTFDENLFSHNSFAISAGPGGATVQIDRDNNGIFEETVTLAEGETVYRDGVNAGGHVLADKPVQVVLFNGTVGSNYASRDTSLLPVYRWSHEYYCPVSTRTSPTDGTVTFLYNPGASPITVYYDYRSSASAYTTASVTVPAGGNARVVMQPANGANHFGAYRFYTTGAQPPVFYAFSAIDADAASGGNQAWDGGFTLVGRPSLTTQVLVSLGIGRDPYSATNPNENGNPIWVTTAGNGHTPERVYVDYNGDNAGPLTDPNGNHYDVHYDVRELQQLKLLDPDGDQSGMLVYTLNPAVRIAAVWGQDPALAAAAQPGLDVASLIPPLREGEAGKKSTVVVDADGDGFLSAGDTVEYDIRAVNSARTSIPGPFAVQDNLPTELTYVPGSTRYRYSVGGNWQAWTSIPDDSTGTPFPLDEAGFSVPGSLETSQQLQVVFRAALPGPGELAAGAIENTGLVEISPYGLLLPIKWTDVVYGSIGDLVWNDLNGNGIRDPGENGIGGVIVWADLNGNGVRDPGEPSDTTDGEGAYLLAGLQAGTYTVRVDPISVAAVNVGFGPSHDLDGVATSHAAVVTLGTAQKRVDADFGYRVGASVGDRVWADLNGNGVQNAGEPGINGVRVYLDLNGNNAYDAGEPNTVTSGDGIYYIGNLVPGTYDVRVDTTTLPAGVIQTFDLNGVLDHEAAVTLIAAEHRGDLDFGYRGNLSIGDLVWEDTDDNGVRRPAYNVIDGRIDIDSNGAVNNSDDGFINGVQIINGRVDINGSGTITAADDGVFFGFTVIDGELDVNNSGGISTADDLAGAIPAEPGIPGIRVYIDANGNGSFDANEASAVTNANGLYSIGGLFNGPYTVRVDPSTLPASFVQTYDLTSPADDHTAIVALAGSSRTDADFGYRHAAGIGDLVWNDLNGNGIRDAGEPGIEGVLVYIDANNSSIFDQGVERFAITDVNGHYHVGNLSAGTYHVRVEISTLPQGSVQTYDLTSPPNHHASRTLVGTENATDVDFGYRANAAFGDFVWNDLNADGAQNPGEPGIPGVRVYVDINGNGVFDAATEPSAVTGPSGAYSIGNLVPGTYTARVDVSTLPAGMAQTFDAVGALDHAATFFVSANQTRTDIDFGYTAPVGIGDFVWNDVNANGVQDPDEPGIPGVNVTAFNAATDTEAGRAITDANGFFLFNQLRPGTYYLVFDVPAGYVATLRDKGADDADSDIDPATGRTHSVMLVGGESDLSLDAGYYQPATVSGHLYIDVNGSGVQDDGEPDLAGVDVIVTDVHGNERTVTTNANGDWTATVPPGETTADVDETDPDYPAGYTHTEGDDPTTVIAASGENTFAGNDGYFLPGAISGAVLADTDGDGTGDAPLEGVEVTLLNADGDPVATTTTAADGGYSFTGLPPGVYSIQETQPAGYASVSDKDGGDPDLIGDAAPVVVTAGNVNSGNDFIEVQFGAISGFVLVDTDHDGTGDEPLAGVPLSLLDASGNPVTDGNGDSITTTTAADGSYLFSGLIPGGYRVAQTQPVGYDSVNDSDGGDPDLIGDPSPIIVLPGATNSGNNFVEALDTCADTWTEWKSLHPGETADGNPDGDAHDNLIEFAFGLPHDSGAGDPFCIRASIVAGAVDGVFRRPRQATDHVTYLLEYAAQLGNPTVWQAIALEPGHLSIEDDGDGCHEIVTIVDLESLTGLTAGRGFVRIRTDLDEDNDSITDHTAWTEVEGWVETEFGLGCRTYNNPFLPCAVFSGTVDGVDGFGLNLATGAGGADLADLLQPGISYYVEIVSGDREGHRFDIVAADGGVVTVADDDSLGAATPPFNTRAGALPADLAGDLVTVRRHRTLGELFPADAFGATGSQSSADQVQVFAGGAWTIYWLYDDAGTPRWVRAGDSALADQAATVIPPGQGVFFNSRNTNASVLSYGGVRANAFVRPLAEGANFVGGGHPVDQSAGGGGGRAMNTAQGFIGDRDFKKAEQFFIWKGDASDGASGYDTWFLLNGAPVQPSLIQWTKTGDAGLAPAGSQILFLGDRSTFIDVNADLESYSIPVPWTP